MNKIIGWFHLFAVLAFLTGCDVETEICEKGQPAKIYYTPDCSTINGYLTLESGKRVVFQHEIDEDFQGTGLDVCVVYEVVGNVFLTAECVQGEVINIISLKAR